MDELENLIHGNLRLAVCLQREPIRLVPRYVSRGNQRSGDELGQFERGGSTTGDQRKQHRKCTFTVVGGDNLAHMSERVRDAGMVCGDHGEPLI